MKFICVFASLLLAIALSFAQKPNIVVFLVDDMGLMDTSVPFIADENLAPKVCELNTLHRTPNMESLSKKGTRFSRAYAMSVCSPSRVSIMTGQTSARHHVSNYIKPESNNGGAYGPINWRWSGIDSKDITMPKLLKEQGYKTIFIGKAHFAPIGFEGVDPLVLGYDVNIGGCAWGQPGSYLSTEKFGNKEGKSKGLDRGVPHMQKYYDQDIFLTEALTLDAIAEIKKAKAEGKPFLLSMSHYAVHGPFTSDKRFAQNFKGTKAPAPWKAFATMVEGMDKSLGDIVKCLEDEGIADNTLIIFLGDNGTASRYKSGNPDIIGNAAPLRGMKATRFEGGMRIPFIISWAKPNADSPIQKEFKIAENIFNATDLVAIYDVFSTVLDLAGAKIPQDYAIDSKSIFEILKSPNSAKDRDFLMHYPHDHSNTYFTSYIKGNWKIIKNWQTSTYELFDLAKDMTESNNLFESSPEKAKEMISAMNLALENAGAQYPDFSKESDMEGKSTRKKAKK